MAFGVDIPGGRDLATLGDALLACHTSLYRYARALCSDPGMAEELLQETFRRALSAKKWPFPSTEENVRPWLFTILRNHWRNEVRQRRHGFQMEELREEEIQSPETPETVTSRRFLQSEVRDAIDALPETYREVIVLREMENLSYAEIAQLVGCPAGTVMSRLARARGQLRGLLSQIAPAHRGARR